MIGDVIALYELLTKKWSEYKVISALFGWDGVRLCGDENIQVTTHKGEDGTWYYFVQPYKDYIFIRMPVNAGCVIEGTGIWGGDKNADARYFRYIAVPDGRLYGGAPANVKVDFMVVG